MAKEMWKDIKGYEGFYQISNEGNVRSISCRRRCHGRVIIVNRVKNMSLSDNGHGYLVVHLKENNKRKVAYVHRLVAEMFLDNPNNFPVVNHIDYNTKNNSVDNLEWTTQKHNVQHSIVNMKHPKTKCKPSNTGEKYISSQVIKGKTVYRVRDKRTFGTLHEAIKYRDEVFDGFDNTN